MLEYATSTTNTKNKVTAVAADSAKLKITVGDDEIESGDEVTWETGENTVEIDVTKYGNTTTYTVTVTKS